MKAYQFNDIPFASLFFISFIYFHMVFNSSSIFMSILNLTLLYNMDMKKHIFIMSFHNFLENYGNNNNFK
jgi:hypothetical protein